VSSSVVACLIASGATLEGRLVASTARSCVIRQRCHESLVMEVGLHMTAMIPIVRLWQSSALSSLRCVSRRPKGADRVVFDGHSALLLSEPQAAEGRRVASLRPPHPGRAEAWPHRQQAHPRSQYAA